MRCILCLVSMFFLSSSFASANQLKDILKDYDNSDINNKCQVVVAKTGDHIQVEVIGSQSRATIKKSFHSWSEQSGVFHLVDHDYPGTAQAYFIPTEHSLHVIVTWEDGEGDKDLSTFCELPKSHN